MAPSMRPAPAIPDNVLQQFSLKGKVAVVTGAAANIGLAVAEAFAEAGADVVFVYNGNPAAVERANELGQRCGVKTLAVKCNVKDFEDVERMVDQVVQHFGRIDIFVANAGVIQEPELVLDGNPKLWSNIIDVNYTSVVSCAAVVGKVFKAQGHGNYIITASAAGHAAVRGAYSLRALYNSLKAGVSAFARSLAYEWADFARVNSVSPGYIGDGMGAPEQELTHALQATVLGRFGRYNELKGAYLYLASDASTFATGTDIVVDGGYSI